MKPAIGLTLVALLVFHSWRRKSLTTLGLICAGLTAAAHALHPWNTPFVSLAVFYLGAQRATKVKHDVKARLTLSATGADGGEGPRNHIQVLANSIIATVLIIAHRYVLSQQNAPDSCFALGSKAADILMVGIVAQYCANAADTYSSELGILSKSKPRLITSLTLRQVPPGTNGGVTMAGLLAGLFGSFTVAFAAALSTPICAERSLRDRALWVAALSFWGLMGSVLDSVLGGLFQATVVDSQTGKVVEGTNGRSVLITPRSEEPVHSAGESTGIDATGDGATKRGNRAAKSSSVSASQGQPSRQMAVGHDWLDNNGVNFTQALVMTLSAMGIAAWFWDTDVQELLAYAI